MKISNKIILRIIFPGICAAALFLNGQSAESQTSKLPKTMPSTSPTAVPKPTIAPQNPADDDDVITVESKLVIVPVSISDARGELVRNLRAEDFILQEKGKNQEIERLSDPGLIPLDIALLIDVSSSVDKRFSFQKEAAERFLRQVFQNSDSVSLFTIDRTPVLIQPLSDLNKTVEKLKTIVPARSTTAFFDTVGEAADHLKKQTKPGRRRVIVVISDGEDTFSEKYLSATAPAAELQRADTIFYSINPGGSNIRLNQMSRRGQDIMQQLAAATGGAAFVPEKDIDLETAFRQITAELRSQYLLQYYSSNENLKKGFVPIQVKVNARPDLRVRARQGYYF